MSYNKLSDLMKLIKNQKNLNGQGFPIVKVDEFFEIRKGRKITQQYIEKNKGHFPVYSSKTLNDGVMGLIKSFDFQGEYLTGTTHGVYCGTVFYRKNKFSISSNCFSINLKNFDNNLKFFYYLLKNKLKKYVNYSTSIPTLLPSKVKSIPIILPPIEIQNKIVEILDPLEEMIKNSEQLEELRQQQLDFYRKSIINFLSKPNYIDKSNIKNVFFNTFKNELISQIGFTNQFPKETIDNLFEIQKGNSKYTEEYIDKNQGQFPVYSSKTTDKGAIGQINSYDLNGKYLTYTTDGANAGTIFYRNGKFSMSCHCASMNLRKPENNLKFFYYLLKDELKKYVNNSSSIPSLSSKTVKGISIAVPPIEIQDKVVEILDILEKLLQNTENLSILYKDKYKYYQSLLLKLINDIGVTERERERERLAQLFNFVFFSIVDSQKIIENFTSKLDEFFEIRKGRKITQQYIEKNKGHFPVYSSKTLNDGVMGFIKSFDFQGEYLTGTTHGVYCGTVFYRKNKFSISSNCFSINLKNFDNNLKFFYHLLKNNLKKYVNYSTSIPTLLPSKVKSIPIILPPIEIQNKVVEILDSLEESWKNQVKLTNLYKKKYNFYQNKLIKLLKEDINEN